MTAANTTPRSGTSVAQPGMLGQAKVRPEDARRYNRSLVLSVLFREAPMSRADLARATGLTRVTISALVADLLEEVDDLRAALRTRRAAGGC